MAYDPDTLPNALVVTTGQLLSVGHVAEHVTDRDEIRGLKLELRGGRGVFGGGVFAPTDAYAPLSGAYTLAMSNLGVITGQSNGAGAAVTGTGVSSGAATAVWQKFSHYTDAGGGNQATFTSHVADIATHNATGGLDEVLVYSRVGTGTFFEGRKSRVVAKQGIGGTTSFGFLQGQIGEILIESGAIMHDGAFGGEFNFTSMESSTDTSAFTLAQSINPSILQGSVLFGGGFAGAKMWNAYAILNPNVVKQPWYGLLSPAGAGGVGFPVKRAVIGIGSSQESAIEGRLGTYSVGMMTVPNSTSIAKVLNNAGTVLVNTMLMTSSDQLQVGESGVDVTFPGNPKFTNGFAVSAGKIISGDMTTSTILSRGPIFQTTGTSTLVTAIPLGAGTIAGFEAYNTPAATGALVQLLALTGEARLSAIDAGAGNPFLSFYTSFTEQMHIAASGLITTTGAVTTGGLLTANSLTVTNASIFNGSATFNGTVIFGTTSPTWTNYTPVLTQSGSITLTTTNQGHYIQIGKLVIFEIELIVNSAAAAVVSNAITISLPVAAARAGNTTLAGVAQWVHSGVERLGTAYVGGGTVLAVRDAAGHVWGTAPDTVTANGDTISLSGSYQAS
jgi:hypothetical protein